MDTNTLSISLADLAAPTFSDKSWGKRSLAKAALRHSRIECQITGLDHLKNCSADQPFLTVANHPFGLAESLALSGIFDRVRQDYKIIAHPAFKLITEGFSRSALSLNDDMRVFSKILAGHLGVGAPIGIFPGGGKSREGLVRETATGESVVWRNCVARIARGDYTNRRPLDAFPVYVSASKADLDQENPPTAFNPCFLRKKIKSISRFLRGYPGTLKITIGPMVPANSFDRRLPLSQITALLKHEVFSLAVEPHEIILPAVRQGRSGYTALQAA